MKVYAYVYATTQAACVYQVLLVLVHSRSIEQEQAHSSERKTETKYLVQQQTQLIFVLSFCVCVNSSFLVFCVYLKKEKKKKRREELLA